MINADGTGRKRLRISPPDAIGAVWSPDGTKIAFASGRERVAVESDREDLEICVDYEICVMNADGSDIRPLTSDTTIGHIHQLRQLTSNLEITNIGPAWSPDGRKIVFIRWISFDDTTGVAVRDDVTGDDVTVGDFYPFKAIYIMDANGENVTRLTHLTQEPSKYWSPVWAPRKKGVEVTEASVIIPEAQRTAP